MQAITPVRTAANAGRLGVVCAFQMGSTETFQTGPVVYRGVMYLTTPRITAAIDAATCRRLWRHEWEPRDEMLWSNNRGVAINPVTGNVLYTAYNFTDAGISTNANDHVTVLNGTNGTPTATETLN